MVRDNIDPMGRAGRLDRSERVERAERMERASTLERVDQADRAEYSDEERRRRARPRGFLASQGQFGRGWLASMEDDRQRRGGLSWAESQIANGVSQQEVDESKRRRIAAERAQYEERQLRTLAVDRRPADVPPGLTSREERGASIEDLR